MNMPLTLVAFRGYGGGYVSWYEMTAADWREMRGETVSFTVTMKDARVPRAQERRRRTDDDPASILARRLRELAADAERYGALGDEDRQSWLRCIAVELRTIGDDLWVANAP